MWDEALRNTTQAKGVAAEMGRALSERGAATSFRFLEPLKDDGDFPNSQNP